MKKMKNARGFTLIEILIVISIISVLSSIAAVNISSRVKLAKDASVKQNLAVLREACGRYYLMNMKMPMSLNDLSGGQVQGIELTWTGANASGKIGYEKKNGEVFLVTVSGTKPLEKDYRGVSYGEY